MSAIWFVPLGGCLPRCRCTAGGAAVTKKPFTWRRNMIARVSASPRCFRGLSPGPASSSLSIYASRYSAPSGYHGAPKMASASVSAPSPGYRADASHSDATLAHQRPFPLASRSSRSILLMIAKLIRTVLSGTAGHPSGSEP